MQSSLSMMQLLDEMRSGFKVGWVVLRVHPGAHPMTARIGLSSVTLGLTDLRAVRADQRYFGLWAALHSAYKHQRFSHNSHAQITRKSKKKLLDSQLVQLQSLLKGDRHTQTLWDWPMHLCLKRHLCLRGHDIASCVDWRKCSFQQQYLIAATVAVM